MEPSRERRARRRPGRARVDRPGPLDHEARLAGGAGQQVAEQVVERCERERRVEHQRVLARERDPPVGLEPLLERDGVRRHVAARVDLEDGQEPAVGAHERVDPDEAVEAVGREPRAEAARQLGQRVDLVRGQARRDAVALVDAALRDRLLDEVERDRAVPRDGEVVVEVRRLVGPDLHHDGEAVVARARGPARDHAHELVEPARVVDDEDPLPGDAVRVLDADGRAVRDEPRGLGARTLEVLDGAARPAARLLDAQLVAQTAAVDLAVDGLGRRRVGEHRAQARRRREVLLGRRRTVREEPHAVRRELPQAREQRGRVERVERHRAQRVARPGDVHRGEPDAERVQVREVVGVRLGLEHDVVARAHEEQRELVHAVDERGRRRRAADGGQADLPGRPRVLDLDVRQQHERRVGRARERALRPREERLAVGRGGLRGSPRHLVDRHACSFVSWAVAPSEPSESPETSEASWRRTMAENVAPSPTATMRNGSPGRSRPSARASR
ncbi:Uncharacterised protein [Mycobacteroides abscessus]|nr:Uncharacterised protein [Mycobacteroides abscessus]